MQHSALEGDRILDIWYVKRKEVTMGVLNGLKILDFSTLLPGPYATLVMADMGAEVLRVSSKSKFDLTLAKPPKIEGTQMNALAATLGRNKKSISLNLKTDEGKEIVRQLVKEYDIVIEQFRPGVMDKLGLGYEALRKINPALIYCALTGYGQTGPLRDRPGHDINYLARSGIISYSGRPGEIPSLYGIQIADLAGGSMNVLTGVLAAVIFRNRTGKGQLVDVSMLDGSFAFTIGVSANALLAGYTPAPASERTSGQGVYDFYETKDGRYLSVGCLEQKFFAVFCQVIGLPELIAGGSCPKNPGEVKAQIAAKLKEKTMDEWMSVFEKAEAACVEPVMSYDEVLRDPQILERNMIVEVTVPGEGNVSVRQIATPLHFSEAPNEYHMAGCPVGCHNQEILSGLGYSDKQIDTMEEKGVFN